MSRTKSTWHIKCAITHLWWAHGDFVSAIQDSQVFDDEEEARAHMMLLPLENKQLYVQHRVQVSYEDSRATKVKIQEYDGDGFVTTVADANPELLD